MSTIWDELQTESTQTRILHPSSKLTRAIQRAIKEGRDLENLIIRAEILVTALEWYTTCDRSEGYAPPDPARRALNLWWGITK